VQRLHTVEEGTPDLGYRQWPPGPPQGRMRACRWGQSLICGCPAAHVRPLAQLPSARLWSCLTAMPIPTADWPMTIVLNVTVGPRAGCLKSLPLVGLRWSLLLVRLPTAEVVASVGDTVSATCYRTSGSLALMASLSPPVGGRGRGPFCSGAHPEVVAAAGKPLGAEVVVAAGAEVVAIAGDPSMQRWSPPLVRLPGASFQRDSCWCSVVHSCKNGARAPLVRECNNICLLESKM
jgi:hypothetical protein